MVALNPYVLRRILVITQLCNNGASLLHLSLMHICAWIYLWQLQLDYVNKRSEYHWKCERLPTFLQVSRWQHFWPFGSTKTRWHGSCGHLVSTRPDDQVMWFRMGGAKPYDTFIWRHHSIMTQHDMCHIFYWYPDAYISVGVTLMRI